MNIKVAAFTESEKSINTLVNCEDQDDFFTVDRLFAEIKIFWDRIAV